jgi:hypothetical protein
MLAVTFCFAGLFCLLCAPLPGHAYQCTLSSILRPPFLLLSLMCLLLLLLLGTVCSNQTQCNYTTIFAAVNASSANDSILVKDGTYTEQATTLRVPLTFIFLYAPLDFRCLCTATPYREFNDCFIYLWRQHAFCFCSQLNGGVQVNGPGNGWLQVFSTWTTTGSFVLTASGMLLPFLESYLTHHGPSSLSASLGININNNASWTQNGNVTINNGTTYGTYVIIQGCTTGEGQRKGAAQVKVYVD